MSPSDIKEVGSSLVKQAEKKLEKSNIDFEHAMEHLEEKLEGTSDSVYRAVDYINKPKRMIGNAYGNVRTAAAPYVEKGRDAGERFLLQAKNTSRAVSRRAQENPRPFIIGGIILACGLIAGAYLLGKRRSEVHADLPKVSA